jgi:hypothetical protein
MSFKAMIFVEVTKEREERGARSPGSVINRAE